MKLIPLTSTTFLASACLVFSQTTTWLGNTSGSYDDSANWSDGSPTSADTIVFGDPASSANQPSFSVNRRSVNAIDFTQAGWNIETGTGNLQIQSSATSPFIDSAGAGVNRISALEIDPSGLPITVGPGNTLQIGTEQFSNGSFEKLGAGTLELQTGGTFSSLLTLTGGSVLANGAYANGGFAVSVDVPSGSWIGGAGSFSLNNRSDLNFQAGASLAPGGDGLQGSSLGTLSLDNDRTNVSAREFTVSMETGSSVAIDVLADGSSDSPLITSSGGVNNTIFNMASGVSLDLTGSLGAGQDYTIATITGLGDYGGDTFGSVTLNGSPLTDGVDYTIAYTAHNAGDPGSGSIILTAAIPEPGQIAAALGLVALATAGLIRHRRGR